MSILALRRKQKKKFPIKDRRKARRRFPIKGREKTKKKRRKFPVKDWEKTKKKENPRSKTMKELYRRVFGPDNI